jgi:hypothetical protein
MNTSCVYLLGHYIGDFNLKLIDQTGSESTPACRRRNVYPDLQLVLACFPMAPPMKWYLSSVG